MVINKKKLRNLLLLITTTTSITSGIYVYLIFNNPIDNEINSIFEVYKNEGDIGYLQSSLSRFSSNPEYVSNDIISDINKVCYNFKSANNKIKNLNIKSEVLLTYTEKLISSNENILVLCDKPKVNFYSEINKPLEIIVSVTKDLSIMKDRKYKLKNTIVDKYPILSFLVFILVLFLFFLLVKKPSEWATYSLKATAPLFIGLTILATSLNPLYSLLILILIAYVGFLLIALNRKS